MLPLRPNSCFRSVVAFAHPGRAAIATLLLALAAGCAREEPAPPTGLEAPLSFQRLTGTAVSEAAPSLSPDGTEVAYERENEIWVLDVATRAARRAAARGNHPSWSADGSALLFVRRDLDGGGPLHRLIRLRLASGALDTVSMDTIDVYEPAAAPVGHAVVLRTLSRVNTRQSLRVVAGDGSNRATLTEAGAWVDTSPAWSVDESFIAFVRVEDGGATRLLRVVADGDSEPTPLTVGGFAVSGPAWHPDGRIVFSREGVISTVRSSGGPVSVLVQGDGFALDPTVSADGRRVVFASDRTGNFELWSLFDPSGVGPGPYLH